MAEAALPRTQALVNCFFHLSRSSFTEGLGALYAYEHQVPEIASTKIAGLKKFYGIHDERSLQFFNVHLKADIYHSDALEDVIESLPQDQREKACHSSRRAHQALWGFLDEMQELRC